MILAIVLAAGKSSRMGLINKMLLPFGGSTIIDTTITALTHSLVDEIIVVEGPDGSIAEHLDSIAKVSVVRNMNTEEGLTSSIQCGVSAANNNTEGFLVCLGDMPMLTINDYNKLINSLIEENKKAILVPKSGGMRGNPVLFSHHFKDEILSLKEKNGCKPIVSNNEDCVRELLFSTNHCLTDIDTMADYKKLLK
jgi:molybdenum cofactor cytidylyltransferase